MTKLNKIPDCRKFVDKGTYRW